MSYTSLSDLKDRYKYGVWICKRWKSLKVGDLKIEGAITALLKEAIKPNSLYRHWKIHQYLSMEDLLQI